MPHYRMTYKYQGCYDAGGYGHDVGWHQPTTRTFEAEDDIEAKWLARAWINTRSGKYPCRSRCGNLGLYLMIKLEEFVPEKSREIKLQATDLSKYV